MRALGRAAAWATAGALVIGLLGAGGAASASQPREVAAVSDSASASLVEGSIVKTADLSKFQPGNIISDAAFFNRGTMSEGQIQAFLQAKVPNCQSGYICLKDWYDTSRTTSADAMCGAYAGGMRERASTIIYRVAQACGINPQVLIVMLQKEQGLVTHTWPSDWRYTIAMGQGCPDTAACDTRYYGFFNQVYGAAWQLKRYANPPGTSQYFTWYAPGTRGTSATTRTRRAAAPRCTSRTRPPRTCTTTRLTSRTPRRCARGTARATDARPTATATSSSTSRTGSARRSAIRPQRSTPSTRLRVAPQFSARRSAAC